MTRREKETICRVLKEAKRAQTRFGIVTGEEMRNALGVALCVALADIDSSFNIDLFKAQADIGAPR